MILRNYKPRLSQRVLILVGIPLCFQFIFVGLLFFLLEKAEHEARLLTRSRAVIAACNEERSSGVRLFMAALTQSISRSSRSEQILKSRVQEYNKTAIELQQLVASDPSQAKEYRELRKHEVYLREAALQAAAISKDDSFKEDDHYIDIYQLRTQSQKALANVDKKLSEIVRLEKQKGLTPKLEEHYKGLAKLCLLVGLLFNCLLVLGLTIGFNKDVLGRLETLIKNAINLSQDKPLLPPVSGNDEIKTLDSAFHEMAADLAKATRTQKAIIDKALEVICALDGDNKFSMVNPACKDVWGYDVTDLIGQRLITILDPNDIVYANQAIERVKAGLATEPFEVRVKTKFGNTIISLWTAQWSEPERLLFCIAHDVTDRRKSEQRLRALIENLPVGLLVCSQKGDLLSASPKAKSILGFKDSELEGKAVLQLLKASDTKSGESGDIDFESFAESSLNRIQEFTALTATGPVPIDLSVSILRVDEKTNYIISFLDVSERHEIERMKSQFVAMITHDLRTPLAALQVTIGNAEQGIYGDINEQGRKRLSQAEANCTRLIGLISDLIDFEKMKEGKFELDLSVNDTEELIQESIDAIQGFADSLDVKLVREECAGMIEVDRKRMIQVLVNLISNAVKFSNEKGSVTIYATKNGAFSEISIKDEGRGIPPSHLTSIFETFSQVNPKDAKERKGSGLGLAICKQIVEAHPGGAIGVESEEGKGSRFWIKLPARS